MTGPPLCRQPTPTGRECRGETAIHSADPVTFRVLSRQCDNCGHVKWDEPNGPSREQIWNERERAAPRDDRLSRLLGMTEPSDDE